jgi:glycerol kinase
MGAAFLAGLAVGVWKDQAQIRSLWQEEKTFTPQLSKNEAAQSMKNWSRAVERSKGWIIP